MKSADLMKNTEELVIGLNLTSLSGYAKLVGNFGSQRSQKSITIPVKAALIIKEKENVVAWKTTKGFPENGSNLTGNIVYSKCS